MLSVEHSQLLLFYLPCYLFLQELNFAKMEQAYFAGLIFHNLAKNMLKMLKIWVKTSKIRF